MGLYDDEWRRLHQVRNRLILWAGLGLLALVAGVLWLDAQDWSGAERMLTSVAGLALWLAGLSYFYFQLMFYRCPRCKGLFAARGKEGRGRSWLPRARCGHCGLGTDSEG